MPPAIALEQREFERLAVIGLALDGYPGGRGTVLGTEAVQPHPRLLLRFFDFLPLVFFASVNRRLPHLLGHLFGVGEGLKSHAVARIGLTDFAQHRADLLLFAARLSSTASARGEDGGFGESPWTYEAPHPQWRGRGPSTPSQTAWGLMALVDGGRGGSQAARRAVEFLLARQERDGTWSEREWTGTGFPGHFYLRYHGYPAYFPLSALGLWRRDRSLAAAPANEGP